MVQQLKFGMDKWFDPTLYWACDYLSMLGLKSTHISKRGAWGINSIRNTYFKITFLQLLYLPGAMS